jgi:hypothetical protein
LGHMISPIGMIGLQMIYFYRVHDPIVDPR